MADEPNRWYQQFERYRLLGPTRSLLAAFNQWRLEKSRKVSTSCPKTWRGTAGRWHWQARAEAWDEHCSTQAAARAEAERVAVLASGFAQCHARVRALDEVARLLLEELRETDKRWLPDVKSIGSGQYAERVDIVRFNAGLVRELRGALDDLAVEMGERVKGIDVTSKGKALPVIAIEVVQPTSGDDEE